MSDKQIHSNSSSKSGWVEVWFTIDKDADGYPESKTWEGLWAAPIGEAFEIQSVPFYLKNVSKCDVVVAKQEEFLRFASVVRHGGHNTYRLLMNDSSSAQIRETIAELEEKGLIVELNEAGLLLAVDVPTSAHQSEIDAYLISQKEKGRWEMQDGYLSSVQID